MLPPESMLKFVACAAVEGHDGDCGPCCVWLGDVLCLWSVLPPWSMLPLEAMLMSRVRAAT